MTEGGEAETRAHTHMPADTAGNKETPDDRAPPPSFCRWGARGEKRRKGGKKTAAAAAAITSGAPRKLGTLGRGERVSPAHQPTPWTPGPSRR